MTFETDIGVSYEVCVCVKERECVRESVCVYVKEREFMCVCCEEREAVKRRERERGAYILSCLSSFSLSLLLSHSLTYLGF